MTSQRLRIVSIDHFVLTVADVEKSASFYSRVLGMERVTFSGDRIALRFGDQKINLHPQGAEHAPYARAPVPGSGDFCLITETAIGDVARHLQQMAIAIELGPIEKIGAIGPIQSVYFRDPDGNLVEVSTYSVATD